MPVRTLPEDAILVAADTETFLIGPGAVAPRLVCLVVATKGEVAIVGNGEPKRLRALTLKLLLDPRVHITWHNASYDLTVLHAFYREDQEVIDALWDATRGGRMHCTKLREKLLNLSRFGRIKDRLLPDDSVVPIKYHLVNLAADYLGKDRSVDKANDAGDSWRMNFSALDGMRAVDYPEEAAAYAKEDALDTLEIFSLQDEAAETENGYASCKSDRFRTALDFALRQSTVEGIRIDPEEVARIQQVVDEQLDPVKAEPLFACGLLTRGTGCRPHANMLKHALELMPKNGGDWEPHRNVLETMGIKFVDAVGDKVNQKLLRDMVEIQLATLGMPVTLTEGKKISIKRAVLEDIAPHNPLIALLVERGKLEKLATTYLPALRKVDRVHPNYDCLKRSGRTSSYGGLDDEHGKGDLYPSVNIQQPHPLVRSCYVPEPGHVLCSIDFSYLELVSFAQKCLDLFGRSVLADKINAGCDPHAFLGAVLAAHLDHDFGEATRKHGMFGNWDAAYELFQKCDGHLMLGEFHKHFRTLAKPTGLGFPGGLGPETFVQYAKAMFGVDLIKMEGSLDAAVARASTLREIWRTVFPESRMYSAWVNDQVDEHAPDSFAYTSPFGMHRAACFYTEIANGSALQTPTSDGVNLAVINVQWNVYHSKGRLRGAKLVGMLHDECLFSFPEDSAHELAHAAAEVMIDSVRVVMRNVKVSANPSLMLRWNKNAKPKFKDGRLVPFDKEVQLAQEDLR